MPVTLRTALLVAVSLLVPGTLAGLAVQSPTDSGGASTASDSSVDQHTPPEQGHAVPFLWNGSSPVDVIVCVNGAGCQGQIFTSGDWAHPLADSPNITGVRIQMDWEPTNELVGAMEFTLQMQNADGSNFQIIQVQVGEESPLVIDVPELEVPEDKYLLIQGWPTKRAQVGPARPYIDPFEQHYTVSGMITYG